MHRSNIDVELSSEAPVSFLHVYMSLGLCGVLGHHARIGVPRVYITLISRPEAPLASSAGKDANVQATHRVKIEKQIIFFPCVVAPDF